MYLYACIYTFLFLKYKNNKIYIYKSSINFEYILNVRWIYWIATEKSFIISIKYFYRIYIRAGYSFTTIHPPLWTRSNWIRKTSEINKKRKKREMKQNILFETNVIHRIYDQPRRIRYVRFCNFWIFAFLEYLTSYQMLSNKFLHPLCSFLKKSSSFQFSFFLVII